MVMLSPMYKVCGDILAEQSTGFDKDRNCVELDMVLVVINQYSVHKCPASVPK